MTMAPKQVRHLVLNELLGEGRRGSVTVKGSRRESMFGAVNHYAYGESGGLDAAYSIPAGPPLGLELRGSFDTRNVQKSFVVLTNASSAPQDVVMILTNAKGAVIKQSGKLQRNIALAPHGHAAIDISGTVGGNATGLVRLQAETANVVTGWVMEKKGNEYVIPVPIR